MAGGSLVYRADDRSLLLPFYRRVLVDPLIPLVPATITPNAITHAGHLLNLLGVAILVGTWRDHGWPFVAATVLLQLYIWCDNADGAHARRTGQCSATGELLDHGLDILNVIYIAYLTSMALGVSPLGWVIVVASIAGAASITYWEQAETGVFRLGMMNQVESGVVLSTALLVSATFGTSTWTRVEILGVSLRTAMIAWTVVTIVFGMARASVRVARTRGASATAPALMLVTASGAVTWAVADGALTTVAAVTILTALNVFFALRMLVVRMKKSLSVAAETVLVSGSLAIAAAVVAGWTLLHGGPGAADPKLASVAFAVLAVGAFGGQSLLDAREAVQLLSRITPRAPAVAQ